MEKLNFSWMNIYINTLIPVEKWIGTDGNPVYSASDN